MPKQWSGTWKGGRTWADKDGRTHYVLRKMVDGRRYTVFLDAKSEVEAEAELALFLRDPEGYRTRSEAQQIKRQGAAYVNADSVRRFLEYLRSQGRTERYVKNVCVYLATWAEDLAGRDLRTVAVQELLRALAKHKTARKNRIIALKSFASWLREVEGALSAAEDATRDLKVPAARPEKAVREKGYTVQEIERLYRALSGWKSKRLGGRLIDAQSVRDVLCVHAKTGMHSTEIERLARGEGKVTKLEGQGEIAATIKFVHKSGRVHVQSIDRQTLAAVERLQARGAGPVESYVRKVVDRTCKSISMRPVRFGELRHSFITWASECGEEIRPKLGGLPLSAIAAVVGHQSAVTTKRFYENVRVPPMIHIPIRLEHPDDGAPIETVASSPAA